MHKESDMDEMFPSILATAEANELYRGGESHRGSGMTYTAQWGSHTFPTFIGNLSTQ